MAVNITTTTELSAVNSTLKALGIVSVNTLDNLPALADAAIALQNLRDKTREVQSRGWYFNSSLNVTFTPSNGEIVISDDILALRPSTGTVGTPGETTRFVLRSNKLFNMNNNNYLFSSAIKADVIYLFDFEELPEVARRYITLAAAKITQTHILSDEVNNVFNEAEEMDAWRVLEEHEMTQNPNTSFYQKRLQANARRAQVDPATRVTSNQQRRNINAG